MIIDASAAVEFLSGADSPLSDAVSDLIRGGQDLHAPHLVDPEVGQAIRRLLQSRRIGESDALGMLDDLRMLPVTRHGHEAVLGRAFELRDNATFYDAIYLAMAERLDVPLLTGDAGLTEVPGCLAAVIHHAPAG